MLFDKVTKEHILLGIKDFEEKGHPNGFGASSTYDLVVADKKYPPKAIMAYANYHAEGRKIENYFSGGDSTDCFKAFERNLFNVKKKTVSLKKEFVNRLLQNPRNNYYDNDTNKIDEALDHYNSFFEIDIYDETKLGVIESYLAKELYVKENSAFLDFSKKTSNHLPRAILGKNNYMKFLSEKIINKVAKKSANQFSWVKTHLELTAYLKDYKDKQPQLISILQSAGVVGFSDKDENNQDIDLVEIDPFTFFCYIYKYGEQRRLQILQSIAKQLNIHFPEDELGIPSSNAQKVWLFPYKNLRVNNEIERLWSFFFDVLENKITNASFADLLTIRGIATTKLTEALFNINPVEYFPINGPTKPYLKAVFDIDPKFKTFDDYQLILNTLKSKTDKPFYQLSYEAWLWNNKQEKPNTTSDEVKYWLYAPGRNAMHWDEFYANGIIGLGWDEIGDLKQYGSKDEIRDALRKANGGEGNKMNNVTANNDFVNTMQIGDIVIVKQGRSKLLGYGIVTSDYFYDDKRESYTSCRTVDWKLKGNWALDKTLVLKTLTDITSYNSEHEGFNKYYEYLMGIMETNQLDQLVSEYTKYLRSYSYADFTVEVYSDNLKKCVFEYIKSNQTVVFNESDFKLLSEIKSSKFSEKTKGEHEGKGYSNFTSFFREKIRQIYRSVLATNQILYGPPGTGKTYYLKDRLFDKYTSKETSISQEQHFETIVSGCSWWQVIAVALLDIGNSKVSDVLEHEWVQKKVSLSNSKAIRQTLWSQLQGHTIHDCEHVNVSNRQQPLIFNKTEDSHWEILEDQVEELVPELYELIDSVEDYNPDPDKTIKHYDFVTFHQSFAYEDFIEGIKPVLPKNEEEATDLGYTIEDGVFKNLCNKAKNDPDNRYAIFIDEINRGNVSAIFGELITLIEIDKRQGAKNELSIKLPYSKTEFSVPSNLDIYGTMNTADRSVEALDTALRRRFEFKEMMPDYNVIVNEEVEGIKLSNLLQTINERIEILIDRDHSIGHSYFVGVDTEDKLANAFNNKIVPLLQEYFYGDYGKIGLVLGEGFIEEKKNKDLKFSNFKYDNKNDFITPTFNLKKIASENIIEAINNLFNTENN